MTEKSVTLKHIVRRGGKQAVFFYDGAATAEDGLLILPVNRPEWIKRAWLSGYNLNPDTDVRLSTWAEVEELMAGESVKEKPKRARSAKSEKVRTSEDSDAGGQPTAGHGVRETESPDSESLSRPEPRTDSGGSADDSEGEAEG